MELTEREVVEAAEDFAHETDCADNCPRCGPLLKEVHAIMDALQEWPKRTVIRPGVAA